MVPECFDRYDFDYGRSSQKAAFTCSPPKRQGHQRSVDAEIARAQLIK